MRSKTSEMMILVVADSFLVCAALAAALWLRFDGQIPPTYVTRAGYLALPFATVYLLAFYLSGLYHRLWRYASTGEALAIVKAVTLGTVGNLGLAYLVMEAGRFPLPRSVFPILWVLVLLFTGVSRFAWRFARDFGDTGRFPATGKPTLIVGAGDAGAAVLRELKNRPEARLVPVGLVDDDPAKQGRRLMGVPVLGGREEIPRLVREHGVQEIIIAIPSASGRAMREIVDICRRTPARVRTLPGIYELLDGRVTIERLREVRIEDLLGREPVEIDLEAAAGYLRGRMVLVTGAGGSIGSELCRQVARFGPRRLVLLGHGENSIFTIHRELRALYPDLPLVPRVASVCDRAAVEGIMQALRPQVIFHAAAHKHVPLMEENPGEALKNNILGTWNVARAARAAGVEVFVLVSTDKAVNPRSVMGASKRVAELVVQELARRSRTRFAVVRFGNVLGSRGSVVPLFRQQIAEGGPVTVTHPAMARYFMTIPEAAQLIIQAGAVAQGGEIFVLDMGEPVRIVDLARTMIRLAGYEPERDIEIVYTGVRPGEKMHEELFGTGERREATRHRRIFVARTNGVEDVGEGLEELVRVLSRPSFYVERCEEAARLLRLVLPNFRVGGAENEGISSESAGAASQT
ncbi:MAG: polysaccharide biosynthesis protein [Desulfotomaculales bacterium]